MKRLLILLFLLWPATAQATLFSYNLSVIMLPEYLLDPRYGNVQVGTFFPQETALAYPYNDNQLPGLPSELRARYIIDVYELRTMFWGLNEISPTDYRIGLSDPGGRVTMDLLYDQIQLPNAPFREPDRLKVDFAYELGSRPWCNTPTTPPCPIGTSGVHTFDRGEFSFDRQPWVVPEAGSFLLVGAGLIGAMFYLRPK